MVQGSYQGSDDFAINEIKCPSCGGPLDLPDGVEIATCKFCGSTVHVSYRQQESGVEPDGTIRDRTTGYGLFRVKSASGWRVKSAVLQRRGSSSRPYIPQVEMSDGAGGSISLRMGEAGIRNSAGMNAMLAMYGGHLAGVSTVNYADVPDPLALADVTASSIAAGGGASNLRFVRQLACPNLEEKGQKAFAQFQRMAQAEGAFVKSPFIGVVLRTYELVVNDRPWKMAVYVELSAAKDGMGVGDGFGAGMMDGLGGLMDSIGGLFGGGKGGGLFGGGQVSQQMHATQGGDQYQGFMGFLRGGGLVGKMQRDRQAAAYQPQQQIPQQPYGMPGQMGQMGQPAQMGYMGQMNQQAPMGQQNQMPTQAEAQQALSQGVTWCSPSFPEYTGSGTIVWSVSLIATLTAPADDFDAQFESYFLPLVSTVEVHPDIESLSIQVAQQEAGRVQQATQTQLAHNQAAFQAQQAAHRQQQAAFDSYNQSMREASDAHHRQFMESSRQQFDHHAPDFSEAILGVNTYTTSDGREVQISVQADRAFENQAGDVIGTSGSFDPGASWTEIPRT